MARLKPQKLVDPQCYDLAKAFIDDSKLKDHAEREQLIEELAEDIQTTIEDFIEFEPDGSPDQPRR